MKFKYKYICYDCKGATCFSARERTQAAGMQCRHCGGRMLDPSPKSLAKDNIATFHDLKVDAHQRMHAKMEPKEIL